MSVAILVFRVALGLACDPQPHITGYYVASTALHPGNGSECAPFPSLDTAVAAALEAGGGTIEVLGNRTDVFIFEGADIHASVFICGRGSVVVLTRKLDVLNTGLLSIRGVSIQAGSHTDVGFRVAGELIIANSVIVGFANALAITDGALILENTSISQCNNVFTISAPQAFLNVSRVTFLNNRESLILVSDESAKIEAKILLIECLFESNAGRSLMTMQTNNPLSAVALNIYGSQFLSNSAPFLYVSGFNIKVAIGFCAFANNRNAVFHIEATQADITLADCEWSNHQGKAIEVLQLVGRLVVMNITFRGQNSDTPIFLANSGEVTQCLFVLSNATYIDSNWTTVNRNAGFLLMMNCAASVVGVTIRNVTVAGLFGVYNGLIDIDRGYAEVRQLSIENSQSNQALLYVVFSSVSIMDSRFLEVGSGLNVLSFLSLSNMHFERFSISGAVGLETSESIAISGHQLMYFVANLNNLTFNKMNINAGVGDIILGKFFGNFSADSLTIVNGHFRLSIFSTVEAVINLSNIYVKNCTSEAIFKTKGQFTVTATNITVESSQFARVFQCSILAHCALAGISISQSASTTLAQAVGASIQLVDIYTHAVTLAYLLKGSAGSLLHFSNATVKDCVGALAELRGSQAVVASSLFDNLVSEKALLSAVQSNITLQSVKMRRIVSEFPSMADIRDASNLYILDSELADLCWNNGITLKDSSATIIRSTFIGFSFTLIIGKSASIFMLSSRFQSGGPRGIDPLLHGGVLFCDKCNSVNLTEITMISVQASQGGGLYLFGSVATIARSSFQQCSAINGGALAIFDTEFHISESNFTACSATNSGGAIDVSNSVSGSGISRSGFTLNSAKVGGAINIRKTVPVLKSVNLAWNTAAYGSDLASYTITARIAFSFPTNVSYVSGNPFPQNLKVELLDHFNQVVLTDSIAQLSFNLPSSVTYGGKSQLVAQNGVIDLGTAPFYAPPDSNTTISATLSVKSGSTRYTCDFSWELLFRPCRLGEVKHIDRCEICTAGKFSLSLADTQCELCSAHAYCPGGFEINIDKGYWRTSINSSELLKCPFAQKCLGGQSSTCEEGYTGKLCSECSESWHRVGTLYCRHCSSASAAIQLILFLLQYCSVFFIAFYVSEISSNEVRAGALQIWIDFCQCSAVMLRLRTELPSVLVGMYQAVLYLGSLSASPLPISCLFDSGQSPYLKMLMVCAASVGELGVLIPLLHYRFGMTRRKVIRLTGIMLYFAGAAVTESFFALLLSIKLGSSSSRWLYEDASIESWSPNHINKLKYIYGPLFAFFVLLPLALLAIALVTARLRRYSEDYCPLLISGLRNQFSFANFVIYCWKLLFILVTMSVTARGQLLQITLSLVMLIFLIPTLVATEVYTSKSLFFLSVGSKLVIFCSASSASYYMEWPASSSTLQYLFTPVLLGLHALVLGVFLKVFVKGKREILTESVERIRPLVQRKSPLACPDPPQNSMMESSFTAQHT